MSRITLDAHRTALRRLPRRALLRGSLSVGALSLLTGCNLEDDDAVDRVLSAMSRWNDRVQAALFSRTRMAPTYAEADITIADVRQSNGVIQVVDHVLLPG